MQELILNNHERSDAFTAASTLAAKTTTLTVNTAKSSTINPSDRAKKLATLAKTRPHKSSLGIGHPARKYTSVMMMALLITKESTMSRCIDGLPMMMMIVLFTTVFPPPSLQDVMTTCSLIEAQMVALVERTVFGLVRPLLQDMLESQVLIITKSLKYQSVLLEHMLCQIMVR